MKNDCLSINLISFTLLVRSTKHRFHEYLYQMMISAYPPLLTFSSLNTKNEHVLLLLSLAFKETISSSCQMFYFDKLLDSSSFL